MQNHVLDYLDNIVKVCPDKVAFADDKLELTFKELYDRTNSIAMFLHNQGLYKEAVLVFMEKSPKTVNTFFGVINAGCFYVPIDSEMPAARINLIIDNVKPRALIVDEKCAAKMDKFEYDGKTYLYDDIISESIDELVLSNIRAKAIDTDPLYIVFTSGSTGVPKGVCACHRSVLDYIEQLSETLEFNKDTVFGNQTPLYFDACLKELYPTLKFGATTYLIPKSMFMFPIKLVEFLNEKKINTVCWVVSALTFISSTGTFDKIKPEHLHTIAFGSEVFPIRQFNLWKNTLPEAKFTNLYGPTEGTGMCCFYHADRLFEEGESIPIGRPFKNTEILLLDDDNKLANEGEICIRGTSVTLGYFNNPEKTAESFVQNPLNSAYPEIIYRTGDIAKYNDKGELLFVSRKDYQIKHMGHRIELGEIEANVNLVEGIKDCACVYNKESEKIVLFYVGEIDKASLTKELRGTLPRYMLPNEIIILEAMPHTPNGKIDRNTLKEKANG